MIEYILIIAVVVSAILVFAKPFFKTLQSTVGESFKAGILGERTNLYYFPLGKK